MEGHQLIAVVQPGRGACAASSRAIGSDGQSSSSMPASISSGHCTLVASSTDPAGRPGPGAAEPGRRRIAAPGQQTDRGQRVLVGRPQAQQRWAADGRCPGPTVQAFRTICRISTPLATGTQGTGSPPTVQDAVSGTSPDDPSACQLTRSG